MIGIRQRRAPHHDVPADGVLGLLVELSAAIEQIRAEMARSGMPVTPTRPGRSGMAGGDVARARLEALSNRQRQVLAGIVRGCPNKVIAWELGLSVRTVEAYRAQVFERLGARNTADAVRLALAAGFAGEVAAG